MVGLLNSPPYGGGLLAPQQSSGLLGSIANFFRPWTPEDRAKVAQALPHDLAPVSMIKGALGAAGGLAMQANEAMPWGGNNPQAIGYDPQAGTIDPSVMIPFATDVAGMATTGSLVAPAVKGGLGMGVRSTTPRPRTFYRGTNPGDTRRISTGDAQWDSHLFASSDPEQAKMYGSQLTTIEAKPDAKILYEGSAEFTKVAGKWRKGENLLQYSSRAAQAAREAGYDAVWFKMQGNVGTAIINPDKFDALD